MSYKEKLGRCIVFGMIPLGILASNFVKKRNNLEQNVQENIISAPDATIVDTPLNYPLLDTNYLNAQKDSFYLSQ